MRRSHLKSPLLFRDSARALRPTICVLHACCCCCCLRPSCSSSRWLLRNGCISCGNSGKLCSKPVDFGPAGRLGDSHAHAMHHASRGRRSSSGKGKGKSRAAHLACTHTPAVAANLCARARKQILISLFRAFHSYTVDARARARTVCMQVAAADATTALSWPVARFA